MMSSTHFKELLCRNNIPAYRLKQVWHAVYQEGIGTFMDMKILPLTLRRLLKEHANIFSFSIAKEVSSQNLDTVKTLFILSDGSAIEGVLMKFRDGRNSVCISSQVGCGLKCVFCATGTMGFRRNLTAEEISDQVLYFDQCLKKNGERVSHVIFMGMGEPFLNFDAVMEAVRRMNNSDELGIAARHITISTSGVIPGIERLTDESLQVNLAVSLHAPDQKLREKIMPIAKAYSIKMLLEVLERYMQKTKRRVSFEYVMLKDINDSPELARKLGRLLDGKMCHVNLIPYNQTYLGFQNAGKSRIDRFAEIVRSFGIPVTVRVSLGQDIDAACGQLAGNRP